MLCSAICLFCVATRDHRCPRQRFPSHRIAAFGERRPTATEWQLFKQLQRAHSAFKRTPGSSGGGFQGVQFTVVACCIPSYFRDSFQGGLPGKKGTYLRPMHPQSIRTGGMVSFQRTARWKTQVVWSSKDETCGSFAESLSSSQRLVVRLSCPEELFEH